MPLKQSSSDKARSENIATEIKSGEDPKRAAAISYAVQRRAKAKGLYEGGDSGSDIHSADTSSGQQDFGSGYAAGGEVGVQIGQPILNQGQLGNEMRLPEMPITVEGDEHRNARLRSEDRPVQRDEYGNALAAGLVGGAGAALRGGARALGSALGRQVVDPDKTAQIAIPPLRQLQAEAAKRLAARGAQKAGEAYVPPPGYADGGAVEGMPEEPSHKLPEEPSHKLPGPKAHKAPEEPSHQEPEEPSHYAMGGQVEAVHNHPSASLRWPLAHLTERGRRQAAYNLGLHMKHHFASGGMAGQELAEKNFPAPEEVSAHHAKSDPAVGETMLPTNYGAGRSLAEAGKSRGEPKPAVEAPKMEVAKAEPAPAAPVPKPLSTEEAIEKERQEERQAALHPSVLDSIRRHVSNGLLAFGGKGIVDYGAQDAAAAEAANKNAQERLAMLHGNRKANFEEAGQEAESPRSLAAKAAAARILGVPSSQFAGVPQADLDHLTALAAETYRTRGTLEEAKSRQALEAEWKAIQARQGERKLDIQQQDVNAKRHNQASQEEMRTARILAPVSRGLQQSTTDQLKAAAQLDKIDEGLARMRTDQATDKSVHAVTEEMAKLLAGGVANQGDVEALLPKSLHSRLAGLLQYATGKSRDTGLAGLTTSQFNELAQAMHQAVNKAYSRNVNATLGKYGQLEQNHPEAFRAWREQAAKGLPLSTYEAPEGAGDEGGGDDVDHDVFWYNQ